MLVTLLLLLLLLLLTARVEAGAPVLPGPLLCDLEQESWDACLPDAACATQWFLSAGDAAEREVFNYLLARYVVIDLALDAPALEQYCVGEPLEPAWLLLLRQARHCPPNEEPDPAAPSGGCRCRSDRQCHEDPPRTVAADVLGFVALALFAIGVFIYYAADHTYRRVPVHHGGSPGYVPLQAQGPLTPKGPAPAAPAGRSPPLAAGAVYTPNPAAQTPALSLRGAVRRR